MGAVLHVKYFKLKPHQHVKLRMVEINLHLTTLTMSLRLTMVVQIEAALSLCICAGYYASYRWTKFNPLRYIIYWYLRFYPALLSGAGFAHLFPLTKGR